MKRFFTFTIILLALTSCTPLQVQTSEPTATGIPQVNIPNPASVHCEQNGNKLEIQTAADGSQSGVCIFPNGSACDEWDYYRGECSPAVENNPTPATPLEATTKADGESLGGNASGGYMPPGTTEELADWWSVSRLTCSDQ